MDHYNIGMHRHVDDMDRSRLRTPDRRRLMTPERRDSVLSAPTFQSLDNYNVHSEYHCNSSDNLEEHGYRQHRSRSRPRSRASHHCYSTCDCGHRSRRRPSRSVRRSRSRSTHYKENRLGSHNLKEKKHSSPVFSTKDVVNIINSIKDRTQASPASAPIQSNSLNHKNILPDFDPSLNNQRVDVWLRKVNECAAVYGWDEKTVIHFAMQKLQGLAKLWYESLDTILFTWSEWQQKLTNAFPNEQNYGQSLELMLRRKSRYNEPIEIYYYEKLALLNQCEIGGKRAVDCIIHGLTDRTMKSSALALRCSNTDQLLQFLMSNKETFNTQERYTNKRHERSVIGGNGNNVTVGKRTNSSINNSPFCFNCRERGHPYRLCSKPLVRCTRCNRIGHKVDVCNSKIENHENRDNVTKKAMCISMASPNSKFYKEAKINGSSIKAFVDFGSEVCLLTKSECQRLALEYEIVNTPLRGFGNEIVLSLGKVDVHLSVDGVQASVNCQLVEDKYLEVPLLIGQTFTEQSHVFVYKTAETLQFIDAGDNMPFSQINLEKNNAAIKIVSCFDGEACGATFVKVLAEPAVEGYVLIDTKLIGKPTQQFVVCGGLYEIINGYAYVQIIPVSKCQLIRGQVLGRGSKVQVVKRIHSSVDDSHVERKIILENEIQIGDTIDEYNKGRLVKLLNDYNRCFASNLKELGCTNTTEMRIELNNKRPIVYRPYRLSHKEREQVREMVGEMLEAGIIRESTSEYSSPIILVRKKDGKFRLCVDFRMLNSVTIKERYPMPIIDDEIARLAGQAYFVTLDLASGYYQVPISEESKPLTSFVTPDGQFEFNRMPFGLANAPAVFQRMMNKVLGSARYSEATAYIDDVLIYGSTVDECLERLEHVLQLIEKANLTLNLSKCEFLKTKVDYLGYEISAAGVRPGDKKIQAVIEFPRPINSHTVRQFLGLVGYFRKFIRNFAQISYPLSKLLKKDCTWTWTAEQEEAFKILKERLVHRPVLAIYDPAAETELHTDASKVGLAGILLQRSPEGNTMRPVAFYSRQTSPEERNFHAYELETLAVVCSLRKFRVYLLGQNFKIVTDCNALRSTFNKRDIIPRIARWYLLMQEFQCTVEYRPGIKMAHVDALSRNPIQDGDVEPASEDTVEVHPYPAIMTITNDDWLHTLQLGDSELVRIRDILTSDLDTEGLKQIRSDYVVKDNKLYRCLDGDRTNLRWVVPKGARWQICRMNHDEIGHFGVDKTLERIRRMYWFPKMSRFVKKYVEACIECAYSKKTSSKEGQLHPITKIEVPFHTVHIDHLGPFVRSKRGNSYLLVVVDAFTKFAFVRPVRNTKTQMAIRVLEDIFYTFRVPDRIISDRGTCFTSHAFKRFCTEKGIRQVLNAVASPRSNGQVERYNRTILASLTALNLHDGEKDWDDKIGRLQWGLNNTVQKSTGKTPAEVMFGTCMNSEINPKLNEINQSPQENNDLEEIRQNVKDRLDREQDKQKKQYDKGRRPARLYKEGELVKMTNTTVKNDGKSKKLLPPYTGPYRIVSVLDNDRYTIAAIPGLTKSKHKRKTTVASDRLKPWVHVAALEIDDVDSENE